MEDNLQIYNMIFHSTIINPMLESLGPAIIEGIIELFQKHQIIYITKQLTNSNKYHHILIGKKRGKRLLTVALIFQKDEYYVELLLHNTARTLDGHLGYQFEDESLNIARLERIIKPAFVCISHPDLFSIIENYIVLSMD